MKLPVMFKKLEIVLLCSILAILCLYVAITSTDKSPSHVKVGVIYYTYYGYEPWDTSTIVDVPLLGYYNCCDPNICRRQIVWMNDIGIDFAIISWWGANTGNPGFEFRNNATKVMFETAKNCSGRVQLAIMVESYNETVNGYNYTQIYDYVYGNFVTSYPNVYFRYGNKPLICFFCNEASAYLMQNNNYSKDPRFTVINLGSLVYAEWLYENYSPFWHGCTPRCRHWAIMPRFDETHIPNRSTRYSFDTSYSEGVYIDWWEQALKYARDDVIDVITISTWNEYPERTMIEPHFDYSAAPEHSDPFYLYNLTKSYIQQLHDLAQVE